jgi:hypothetical protein
MCQLLPSGSLNWDSFWSGGIANPIEAIEQITYLLFLKFLVLQL